MPSLEPPGENAASNTKAIAMARTRMSLPTATGRLEDRKRTQRPRRPVQHRSRDRYSRFEPHIARSVSPRCLCREPAPIKSEKSLKPCWESHQVEVAMSRLNQGLSRQFDAWRERRLQEHWRVLYAGRRCISAFVTAKKPMPLSF
jgi:hypothetical protein